MHSLVSKIKILASPPHTNSVIDFFWKTVSWRNVLTPKISESEEFRLIQVFANLRELQYNFIFFINRLGAYALIVTVMRQTPLHEYTENSNTTGTVYTRRFLSILSEKKINWKEFVFLDLVVLYLVYVIFILCYVKIVLNELKVPGTETFRFLDEGSSVESIADNESNTSKKKKPSKREMLAKAFYLDIVFNTATLVVKERPDKRRWIIILFLVVNIIANIWPYHKGWGGCIKIMKFLTETICFFQTIWC